MIKSVLIIFLLITSSQTLLAQRFTKSYCSLEKEVKSRLAFLEKYTYSQQEDLDVEAYANKTAVLLTNFLAMKPLSDSALKKFTNLKLSAKSNDDLKLRVYDFGFHCGGTRGWITHPIIQWQAAN